MRKTRKTSIAALILTAILSLFAFVACGKEEKELTVSSESVTVKAGASITVTATLEGASSYEWSSDKTEIATVDGGVITGVTQGNCNVTVKAEADGQTYEKTIPVTVSEGDPVAYTVEYYVQQNDFTFAADKTESAEAPFGSQVKITPVEKTGYVIDSEKSVLTGKAAEGLVLKVYYAFETNRIAVTRADGTTSQYYVYKQAGKVLDANNAEITDFSVFALTPDTQTDFYFFDANGKAFRRSLTKQDFLSFDNQTMITERASKDAVFNTVTNTQNVRARNSSYTVDFTDQWSSETAAYIYRLETVSLSDIFYYSVKIRNFADGLDTDISAGFTFADVKDGTKNAQFYIGGNGSNRVLTQNNSYAWEAGQSTREVTSDAFAATNGDENLLELFYSNGNFVFYLNGTYLATVKTAEITGKGNQAGLFGSADELLVGLAQWRFNHSAQFNEVTLLTGNEAQAKFDGVSAALLAEPELRAGDKVVPVIGTPYGNVTEGIEWSANDAEIAAFEDGKLVLKKYGNLEVSASFSYLGSTCNVSGDFVVYDTPWSDSRNARRYADNRIETTANGWSGAWAYLGNGGTDFYMETFVSSADLTTSVGLTAKASGGASVQFYLSYWNIVFNANHAWEANASTKTVFSLERPIADLRLLKTGGVTVAFAHKDGVFRIFYEGFEVCSVTDEEAYGMQAGDGFSVGVASWNNSVKAVFNNYGYTFDSAEVQAKIDASVKTSALAYAKYNKNNGSIETSIDGWRGAYALLDGSGNNFYAETTITSSDAGTSAGFTVMGKDDASIQIYVTYWNIVVNANYQWATGASTTVYSIAEGSFLFLTDGFRLGVSHIDGVFRIYYEGFEVYSFADDAAETYGMQAGENGFRVGVANWNSAQATFTDYSVTFREDEIRTNVNAAVKVSSSFHAELKNGGIETSIGGWRGAYAVLKDSGENFFFETSFDALSENESVGFTVAGSNGVTVQVYFTYNSIVVNSGYQWSDGASKTIYTGAPYFNFVSPNTKKIALAHNNGVFHLYYEGFEIRSFTDAEAYSIQSAGGLKVGVATWNNEANKVRFTNYAVTFDAAEIAEKMGAYVAMDTIYKAVRNTDGSIETVSRGDWSGAYAVFGESGNAFSIETRVTYPDTSVSAGFTVVGANGSIQFYVSYGTVQLNCNYQWSTETNKALYNGTDMLLQEGGTVLKLEYADGSFSFRCNGTLLATVTAEGAFGIQPAETGFKAGVASWNNTSAIRFSDIRYTVSSANS